jgi:hypothetical protein
MADRSAVIARIDALLKTVSTPSFQAFYVGEPVQVPSKPVIAFWYVGDEPYVAGAKTLGNVMITERIRIRAYFPVIASPTIKKNVDGEIWDTVRNVKAALRGDSNLNSLVTDLDLDDATVDYFQWNSGAVNRIVTFDLLIHDLEAETITP